LMDFRGDWKAAGYELARLYAPSILSLFCDSGVCRVTVAYDNVPTTAKLSADVTLVAYSTSTGAELRRFEMGTAQVRGGERKVVAEVPLSDLPRCGTLFVAQFGELRSWRLASEPKDIEVSAPQPIRVRVQQGALELESAGPLIDLLVEDAAGRGSFADNFLCILPGESTRVRYRGDARGLTARSLAGYHHVSVDG